MEYGKDHGMGTCIVGSAMADSSVYPEARRADAAGIRRAARAIAARQAGRSDCGYPVALPRADALMAEAATGKGITWTEPDGRKLRAQIWAPGPYVRSYWMLLWSGSSHFPGELRLAQTDAAGGISMGATVYNAAGKPAHLSDGSTCYGGHTSASGGWRACEGCTRDKIAAQLAQLAGRYVRVTLAADESYGVTLRWGTLREVTDGRAVFDPDLHDSSGVRESWGMHGSNTLAVSDIREVCAA